MRPGIRLGKRPARHDTRVPLFSAHTALPEPPPSCNWNAEVAAFKMLGNDTVGDCTVAATMHLIMQQSAYASPGHGLIGTTAEALAFYTEVTGYNPADPSTDQGAYMLGQGSITEMWSRKGIVCGGKRNHPKAILQVPTTDTTQWKQAVHTFGALLIGINLPENVVSGVTTPFVWDDPSGPVAGGHEVLIVSYLSVYGREVMYDIISWGETYRCTETFLKGVMDEAICVYDPVSLNARGLSPIGLNEKTLLADMTALQAA